MNLFWLLNRSMTEKVWEPLRYTHFSGFCDCTQLYVILFSISAPYFVNFSAFFLLHLLFQGPFSDFCSIAWLFLCLFFPGNIQRSQFWFAQLSNRQISVQRPLMFEKQRNVREKRTMYMCANSCMHDSVRGEWLVFSVFMCTYYICEYALRHRQYLVSCMRSGCPTLSSGRADVTEIQHILAMWVGRMVQRKK